MKLALNINDILGESVFFGMILSLLAYKIGFEIQKKYKKVFLNPLLIAIILIIAFLSFTGISYETYQNGAKYLSYFLTPVTVCLAVPLYKQMQTLKENMAAVVISIFIGCIVHGGVLIAIAKMCNMNRQLLVSIMSKHRFTV